MGNLYRRYKKIINYFLAAYFSAVCFADWREGKIANGLNAVGFVTAVFLCLAQYKDALPARLAGSFIVFLIFMFFNFFGGIGGGDVKCFVVLSLMCGAELALKLIFVSLLAAVLVWGFITFFHRGEKGENHRIKLGIYMPAAHIITMLMGGI